MCSLSHVSGLPVCDQYQYLCELSYLLLNLLSNIWHLLGVPAKHGCGTCLELVRLLIIFFRKQWRPLLLLQHLGRQLQYLHNAWSVFNLFEWTDRCQRKLLPVYFNVIHR